MAVQKAAWTAHRIGHPIDREYLAMKALQGSDVQVPRIARPKALSERHSI